MDPIRGELEMLAAGNVLARLKALEKALAEMAKPDDKKDTKAKA